MVQKSNHENLKRIYPVGTKIKLLHMDDPYTTLKAGDEGIVTGFDDLGTLQMQWSTGSTLGLVYGVDRFEKVVEQSQVIQDKAIFVRKAANLTDLKNAARKGGKPEPFIIEKILELVPEEYVVFAENLLSDYDFISENLELMHKDKNGVCHCLLIKAKDSRVAILVESEGYAYPRYTALLNK